MQKFPWLTVLIVLLVVCTVGNSMVPPLHRLLHRALPAVFKDEASGTVTSTGSTGDWTMHVDSCQSGERQQFFGIAFFDHAQPQLGGHVLITPGVAAQLSVNHGAGSNQATALYGSECRLWDVDIRRTNNSFNDVEGLKGHAHFDCGSAEAGLEVKGDLEFRECH